jgi:hypothetical protein
MLRLARSVVVALALLGGPAAGDATAACTAPAKATAYDNPADEDASRLIDKTLWEAQSFTVPASVELNKVSLYVRNVASTTDSLTVEIRSNAGGSPGTLLGTRNRTLTNTTPAFADFDFSSDRISLASATTYYIVATNASDFFDGYAWQGDQSSPAYPGGSAFSRDTSGASWTPYSPSEDFLFQVWGQTCSADTLPGGQNAPPPAAVSGLAFSNATFAAQGSGPPATKAKRRPPRGTKVSFRLNEAASVGFTVTQRAKGRKVKRGRKTVCVKRTRKNRKRKRCSRVVRLKGSFSRDGVAGKNSFHFTGRLNGRKLKPGRYRLVATPTAGGQKGKSTSSGFRIVR